MRSTITSASVKVMRSYDYCHFEICLSSNYESGEILEHQVDELRKAAARLADKAVEQYKTVKAELSKTESDAYGVETLYRMRDDVLAKPESERTPRDKAILSKCNQREFYRRRKYDYEDDWQENEDFNYDLEPDTGVPF